MKKSHFVFLIMSCVYLAVAVLSFTEIIVVSDNILLGLSMAALLMSLSEIFEGWLFYRVGKNELRFICLFTANVLKEMISSGSNVNNNLVSVGNMKKNVEQFVSHYELGVHPSEYLKNKKNHFLQNTSVLCFVLSITVFLSTPFLPPISAKRGSMFLTLLAFSVMCLNLFVSECVSEIGEKRNSFFNNTQIIIETIYPGFSGYLNRSLYYHEDCVAPNIGMGGKTDAHT